MYKFSSFYHFKFIIFSGLLISFPSTVTKYSEQTFLFVGSLQVQQQQQQFNNWFMARVRLSSYGCTREFAKHEGSERVAAIAEGR